MRRPPQPSSENFDVVVIGAGPAGSLLATRLAKAGVSVLLLERHEFPRYHIGESLTGIAGDYVRELGLEPEMQRLQFPEKHGVKVIGRDAKSEFFVAVMRPTWSVRRAEFDQLLLERAIAAGAQHRLGSVKRILTDGTLNRVIGIGYRPDGAKTDLLTRVRCRFVADCSGHSALLSKHGIAGPRKVDAFDRQVAVFSQYRGALRDPGVMGNATVIFYSETNHWSWFIPLSPDQTSVGVVVPASLYKSHANDPEALLRWGLEHINPELKRRVVEANAEQTEPARFIGNYSYRIEPFAGDGWLCVGDAHRFADPIFSFGVAFALNEADAAAKAILRAMETNDSRKPFAEYVEHSNRGQDAVYDLIRYFWKFPAFFGVQSRGAQRKDIVRLLAGDCFGPELPALAAMRRSLKTVPLTRLFEQKAARTTQLVRETCAPEPAVSAAFLDVTEDGILLYLLLEDHEPDVDERLITFEESLYAEFGRANLAVIMWPHLPGVLPLPNLERSRVVMDRRGAAA